MARIKVRDLPKGRRITKEDMKKMRGGIGTWPTPERPFLRYTSIMDRWKIDTVPVPE